ncbi:oligosaccharide flippase family protein [Niallia circulans]|uniref:oligosaccharide flippase family protein n=1 Tax=Niallia circulans TaxID=1397 RepID=UPI00351232F0
MQEKSKFTKNLSFVLFSNLLTVIIGIVTGLLLPKYMSIENYAYYRIFTLYLMYNGFAHLGFNDGILLKYGSFDYSDIPKVKFRTYFKFIVIFQIMLGIVAAFILLNINQDPNKKVIFLFVLFNMIIINITSNLSISFQITKNFKVVSFNIMLQNLILMTSILFILLLNYTEFIFIIFAQTITNLFIFLKYFLQSKELVFGKKMKLADVKPELINLFSNGFPLLIGNIMGLVIFGIGRIAVERFFTLEEFAYFSFAISLLSLVFSFISAVSNLLFPYIARIEKEKVGEYYNKIYLIVIFITSFSLLSFFILKYIIQNYIPQYNKAINIALLLYPLIIYRSVINLVAVNFYKVLSLTKDYNKNNFIALIIVISLSLGALILKLDLDGFTFVYLISFYFWLLYTDIYFSRFQNFETKKFNFLIVIISILFLFSGSLNWLYGLIIYFISLVIVLLIFMRLYYYNFIKILLRKTILKIEKVVRNYR